MNKWYKMEGKSAPCHVVNHCLLESNEHGRMEIVQCRCGVININFLNEDKFAREWMSDIKDFDEILHDRIKKSLKPIGGV